MNSVNGVVSVIVICLPISTKRSSKSEEKKKQTNKEKLAKESLISLETINVSDKFEWLGNILKHNFRAPILGWLGQRVWVT